MVVPKKQLPSLAPQGLLPSNTPLRAAGGTVADNNVENRFKALNVATGHTNVENFGAPWTHLAHQRISQFCHKPFGGVMGLSFRCHGIVI